MPTSSSITRMLALPFLELGAGAETGRFKGSSTSGMDRFPQQGKFKMKGCAGADRALHMDLACVFLNDAVGDRKSQPRAAPVARPGHRLGGEERVVDALQMLG